MSHKKIVNFPGKDTEFKEFIHTLEEDATKDTVTNFACIYTVDGEEENTVYYKGFWFNDVIYVLGLVDMLKNMMLNMEEEDFE